MCLLRRVHGAPSLLLRASHRHFPRAARVGAQAAFCLWVMSLDAASCVIMDRVGAILNLCWICRLDVPTKILRMGLAVLMVRSEWGCAGVWVVHVCMGSGWFASSCRVTARAYVPAELRALRRRQGDHAGHHL